MKRSLNFLHLTTFYPPYSFGGDAIYVHRLCHALGEAGHGVDVIHCVDSYNLFHKGPPETEFQIHHNVQVHGIRSGWGWLSPLVTQQTGMPGLKRKRVKEILETKSYDVIQYHNTSLLGPGILSMTPRNIKFIKLYMTHEHWLICPTHALWKFKRRPCEKPACLPCTLYNKRPPQLWRYTRMLEHASRHIDRFLSPSWFTANMHEWRNFPFPVGHLPYFLDRTDKDWEHPEPRPQERPYFLFVGRLERIKGLQTLIDLWGRCRDVDLLVAGVGTESKLLRELAGGNSRVKFLGSVSQKELGPLYAHTIACIVPSITYETFGMIIIEAFARKAPVIVRDLGALPEVVRESNGGFIYRTDRELLNAMQLLRESPGLRFELGENGYRTFLRYWSKEAHLKLYLNLLEEIAEKKFGTAPWERAGDGDKDAAIIRSTTQ